VLAGAGYSTDTQSVTPYACFDTRPGRVGAVSKNGEIEHPVFRFEDLERRFEVDYRQGRSVFDLS